MSFTKKINNKKSPISRKLEVVLRNIHQVCMCNKPPYVCSTLFILMTITFIINSAFVVIPIPIRRGPGLVLDICSMEWMYVLST